MLVPKVAILGEILELEHLGLINSGNAIFGLTDINPSKMNLEGQGDILYKLMQLKMIDQSELEEIAQLLR